MGFYVKNFTNVGKGYGLNIKLSLCILFCLPVFSRKMQHYKPPCKSVRLRLIYGLSEAFSLITFQAVGSSRNLTHTKSNYVSLSLSVYIGGLMGYIYIYIYTYIPKSCNLQLMDSLSLFFSRFFVYMFVYIAFDIYRCLMDSLSLFVKESIFRLLENQIEGLDADLTSSKVYIDAKREENHQLKVNLFFLQIIHSLRIYNPILSVFKHSKLLKKFPSDQVRITIITFTTK